MLAAHLELVTKGPAQGPEKGTGSKSPGEFPYWVEGLHAPAYRCPTAELTEYLQPGYKHSILGKQAELPRAQALPALLTEEEVLSPSIAAPSFGEPVQPQSLLDMVIPTAAWSSLRQHGHPLFGAIFCSSAWTSLL